MTTPTKINLTKIRKLLKDVICFNPKNEPAYKFAIESGNPDYCMTRAREILAGPKPDLIQAIRLLIIAKLM